MEPDLLAIFLPQKRSQLYSSGILETLVIFETTLLLSNKLQPGLRPIMCRFLKRNMPNIEAVYLGTELSEGLEIRVCQ